MKAERQHGLKAGAKLILGLGVLLPWFFWNALGSDVYWVSGAFLLSTVLADLLPPRVRHWWWNLATFALLLLGVFLIWFPIYVQASPAGALALFSLGTVILSFVGYSALAVQLPRWPGQTAPLMATQTAPGRTGRIMQ